MNRLHLRLPATSANLGSGFDALALALRLYLDIEAEAAGSFSIEASGRNADLCAVLENNLLIQTYCSVLAGEGVRAVPLHIRMHNQIPLGMGCGSSAAVRLAAIALASHFGALTWDSQRILSEACRLEGHPDNAAACWLGGFVASSMEGDRAQAISLKPPSAWRALLVMPEAPLPTSVSRALLPDSYRSRDVIANLQRAALLTAAFAVGDPGMIAAGMRDRLHQSYRMEVCPLLPVLLPLAGMEGIAGVALSGAGPAVLLLTISDRAAEAAHRLVREATRGDGAVEILTLELENEPVQRDSLL